MKSRDSVAQGMKFRDSVAQGMKFRDSVAQGMKFRDSFAQGMKSRDSFAQGGFSRDMGFMTVQFVVAVGLSLVLLVIVTNLIVFSYGRGVVRAALDEGVRAGTRVSAGAPMCEARAGAVLDDLLGGTLGSGVAIACTESADIVAAQADVHFDGWLPTVPDWSFTVSARARRTQVEPQP